VGAEDSFTGFVILCGTPVAIVAWIFLRQRHEPKADVRPGFKMLSLWVLLVLLSVGVGVGALGGLTGGLANFYFALFGAASAVMLWVLYWKIGVRPRNRNSVPRS
jgi:hypothetical protein